MNRKIFLLVGFIIVSSLLFFPVFSVYADEDTTEDNSDGGKSNEKDYNFYDYYNYDDGGDMEIDQDSEENKNADSYTDGNPVIDPLITITAPKVFPEIQKGSKGRFEYKLPNVIGYEDFKVEGTVRFYPIEGNIIKVDEDGNYRAVATGKELLGYTLEISDETFKRFKEQYGKDIVVLEETYILNIYVVDDKNVSEIKLTDNAFSDNLILVQGRNCQFVLKDVVGGVRIKRNVDFNVSERKYIGNVQNLQSEFITSISGEFELTCRLWISEKEYERLKKHYPKVTDIQKEEVRTVKVKIVSSNKRREVYRLYNPNSGKHFYTINQNEKNAFVANGWNYEGAGWYAPKVGTPVYRLYNLNSDDYYYTINKDESNDLVKNGWENEGIAFYSSNNPLIGIYREYNPNSKSGGYHYTADENEDKQLGSLGWKREGIVFRGTYSFDQSTKYSPDQVKLD